MKWKIHERLILAFYATVGAFGSVALGYYAVVLYLQMNENRAAFILFPIAIVLLAWSVRVFLLALKHEPKLDKSSVTVQHTDQGNGEVRISVAALDQLVKQAIVGNSEGVVDIKTHLINHEDSISVRIEMALNSDVHIPNATMLLQTAIKNFIEEFSGIAVRDVSIMVTTIIPVPQQLALSDKKAAAPEPAVVIAEEETPENARTQAAEAVSEPAENEPVGESFPSDEETDRVLPEEEATDEDTVSTDAEGSQETFEAEDADGESEPAEESEQDDAHR